VRASQSTRVNQQEDADGIVEYWIQLENRPWDCCPHGIDRMTGTHFPSIGILNGHNFYKPLGAVSPGKPFGEDALIFRRYTPNWAAPDDRKVNPWDLNEPDPTNTGTKGTIPGPVIEANVGDDIVVHFRNMDSRSGFDVLARTHSMHPHGVVFQNTSDGAYPLSPPDPTQPIPAAEAAAWTAIGVTGPNKMGDRVPPGGTFTYTWRTFGWPTTAGVWLYHDHSICDMDNVNLGAIGILVIHNLADVNNDFVITPADLPDGNVNGSPVSVTCFPFPLNPAITTLPNDLTALPRLGGAVAAPAPAPAAGMTGMPGMSGMTMAASGSKKKKKGAAATAAATATTPKPGAAKPAPNAVATVGPPVLERLIDRGGTLLELDPSLTTIIRFCTRNYRNPPAKGLYLMLFHELTGAPGMAINGRVFLGNTPTIVSGTATKMRFGVVGMGNVAFHTFHLHGHRWIMPGADGNTPNAIQASPQVTAVSQFEDTRIFGPANSFVFTINGAAGSFMRAGGPGPNDAKGEWHMHCHVLSHMMMGMMGSLLIVGGGETASTLPSGVPCPAGVTPQPNTFVVQNTAFTPASLTASSGAMVNFDFQEANHTVTTSAGSASPIEINGLGNSAANKGVAVTPIPTMKNFMVMGNPGDQIKFECGIHGPFMHGTITIV